MWIDAHGNKLMYKDMGLQHLIAAIRLMCKRLGIPVELWTLHHELMPKVLAYNETTSDFDRAVLADYFEENGFQDYADWMRKAPRPAWLSKYLVRAATSIEPMVRELEECGYLHSIAE